MDALRQDVGYALRSFARRPAFTAVAVLTLALGIGASTAVFTVAEGVLLRPLPYSGADDVVTVWASWDNFPDKTWLSVPEYQLFHQEARSLVDLALYRTGAASFTSAVDPEQVGAAFVTPNTLDVLGVTPVLGRMFSWDEARDGNTSILLAHSVWTRRYGGDPTVVGSSIEIDGRTVQVLGVLPDEFALPLDLAGASASEIFYPLWIDLDSPAPDLGSGGSHGSYGVGRLRSGVTVEEARADLERVMAAVPPAGLYSAERRFTPRVFAAKDDVVGSASGTIAVLLGAVALLLLIACGNVANLLLSRSEARSTEVAVRAALGAGSARITRQLITESLLLSAAAGALGLSLAAAGVRALLAIDPAAVPRAAGVSVDWIVVLFTLAVAGVTTLLFGLLPAVRMGRTGPQGALRKGGRSASGGAASARFRGALVASQMAMAVVLLTASGLTMRSFVRLLGVDAGFARGDVLTLRLTTPQSGYPDAPAVARFYEDLLARIEAVPGVRDAAAVRLLPLVSTMGDSFFRPVGYEARPNEATQGEWQWATPGYFEIMGIPLLEGRTFGDMDGRDAQPVVMVNEAMARRYWGAESPLGHAILAAGAPDTAVVVGVVGDVRHNGLVADAKPQYYVPHAQVHPDMVGSMRGMTLTVSTEGAPARYLEAVRAEVRALDPTLPVAQVMTLEEALSRSVAQPRLAVALLGMFAALALALAAIGIYGVLSYLVSRRTREIGIRVALGAEPGQVVGMVVRQGFLMAAVGVACGTALAWILADAMRGIVYGIAPQDPATFAASPLVLLAVALVACWIPASRAARVQPSAALTAE